MAKQLADTKTLEIPGMPLPTRRGRPPKGDRAMTPAERKAASRKAIADANWAAIKALDTNPPERRVRKPVQLTCMVDMLAHDTLKIYAKRMGITIGELIDLLAPKANAVLWERKQGAEAPRP